MRLIAHVIAIITITVSPLHASEAATVGDTVITTAELERVASVRLLAVRSEAYEARRDAIDDRIGKILVAERAAEAKLSPAEWLDRETAKRLRNITPEEVAAAYETLTGSDPSKPKAQAMAELAQDMRAAHRLETERAVMRELRTAANVEIRIEPPRLDRRDLGGAVVHGPDDAPVTMVVFEDFQCPRCALLAPVLSELRDRYPEHLRIIHRDFPLANHPQAKAAAEAVACATEQGRFWEMAEALYAHQDSLTRASFDEQAGTAGLDRSEFASCLDSGRQARAWKEGVAAARALALRGTPTIFINGRLVSGVRGLETYADIIEEELRRPR